MKTNESVYDIAGKLRLCKLFLNFENCCLHPGLHVRPCDFECPRAKPTASEKTTRSRITRERYIHPPPPSCSIACCQMSRTLQRENANTRNLSTALAPARKMNCPKIECWMQARASACKRWRVRDAPTGVAAMPPLPCCCACSCSCSCACHCSCAAAAACLLCFVCPLCFVLSLLLLLGFALLCFAVPCLALLLLLLLCLLRADY